MKKFLIATLALLSVNTGAFAIDNEPEEGVTTQIFGGLSTSTITGLDDYKARAGAIVGAKFDYMLPNAKGTYISAGLDWVMKGARNSYENDFLGHEKIKVVNSIPTHYLELPIRLGFRYNMSDDLGFYGEVGPYFALGLAGKNKVTLNADGAWTKDYESSYDIFKHSDSKVNFKRVDVGVGFHFGAEYDNHYSLNLGFDWGLIDMYPAEYRDHIYDTTHITLDKVKNFNFTLTFGYRL